MVKKEVFSAGFSAEKSAMSEPLTKDKILYAPCNQLFTQKPKVMLIHIGVIPVQDLKSALEEFEELMQADIYSFSTSKRSEDKLIAVGFRVALTHIKKAFPAIYEQPLGCEVKGEEK